MEVKWNRVKGRFSHRAHLRRLAGLQKRELKKTFRRATLPAAWEKALERYDASGFTWQSESIGGKGVLVYHPVNRAAFLIQFLHQATALVERVAPRLLASFRVLLTGDAMPWEIFDIRATVPVEFGLQRFRFEAGRYELNFAAKTQQLRMIRFGPAAVLLRRQDLAALARDSFHPGRKRTPQYLHRDAAAVEGQVAPLSAVSRVVSRIRRRPVYRVFRLWHEMQKNRILGVQISGRNPIDRRQFSTICETYESI